MVVVTGDTAADGGSDLLSSIALVRELLKEDPKQHVNAELSAAQQWRYENRIMMEEERKAHIEIVEDLQLRLEQAKKEARQEKIIRMSLEETNEALEKHAAELSAAIDTLKTSRTSSPSVQTDPSHAESIKGFEAEKEELNLKLLKSQIEVEEVKTSAQKWKNSCHESQRQVKELQAQLETMKKEFHTAQARRDGYHLLPNQSSKNYDSFQRRLEDSIVARRNAKEGLDSILRGGYQPSNLQNVEEQRVDENESIPVDWKLKYEETLTYTKGLETKIRSLEDEISFFFWKDQYGNPSKISEADRESMKQILEKMTVWNKLYVKTKAEIMTRRNVMNVTNGDDPMFDRSSQLTSKLNAIYTTLGIQIEESINELKSIVGEDLTVNAPPIVVVDMSEVGFHTMFDGKDEIHL